MSYTYTNAIERLGLYQHNLSHLKINSIEVSVPIYRELRRLKAIREVHEPQKGLVGAIKGLLCLNNLQEVVSIGSSEYPLTITDNSIDVVFNCSRRKGTLKKEELQVHFADDYLSGQSAQEILLATSAD